MGFASIDAYETVARFFSFNLPPPPPLLGAPDGWDSPRRKKGVDYLQVSSVKSALSRPAHQLTVGLPGLLALVFEEALMTHLNTVVWGEGEPAIFVHGSMGWGTDTFAQQKSLSDGYKLILLDRRGYGDSPPTVRSDFEVDAQDIVDLLGDGAHLVGQSYGAVVCLLAAGRQPDQVRSLTVIEPPALRLVRGDAVAEQVVDNQRRAYMESTPEAFYLAFIGASASEPHPELKLSPKDIAAIRTTMTERPPWEAEIPLAALAAARFPKLVASGDWMNRPLERRATRGRVFKAICDILADQIGAERVTFANASHNPQLEVPQEFNARLRMVWESTKQ